MGIISIDLGTTNIKVVGYDKQLQMIDIQSKNVVYDRNGPEVTFDANLYFEDILELINKCYANSKDRFESKISIVLTGQAESFVLLDTKGRTLEKAISWLDMRSENQCKELSEVFDIEESFKITGQPEIIPTWPITKLLWLRQNRSEVLDNAWKILMIKDFVAYKLTGNLSADNSIYPFSYYFDVEKRDFWYEPLEYCGIKKEQLPNLVAPCSIIGKILNSVSERTSLSTETDVNIGTLDHFAGMIGTGNLKSGTISESAGTVNSIASYSDTFPNTDTVRIPFYCGPFNNTYIYLPVCESGGMSLEWFKKNFLPDLSFDEICNRANERSHSTELTFLPYITGVNPPEFDKNASGLFYGINASHTPYDFALAIMYGVACLLRKNVEHLNKCCGEHKMLITTGGGAKSNIWCQIKANICNMTVVVPENEEASSLGAAIISAVTNKYFDSYELAVAQCVKIKKTFIPSDERSLFEKKYELFCKLYDSTIKIPT